MQNFLHSGLQSAAPFPSHNCLNTITGNGPPDDDFHTALSSQTVTLGRQLLNLQRYPLPAFY
jgi:hypothetical protein